MTRVNLGIGVEELCDQMLLAEHHEIPRIATLAAKRVDKDDQFDDIPGMFTLGSGHVKYFYDKGDYILLRIALLREELLFREFSYKQYTITWPESKYTDLQKPIDSSIQIKARPMLQTRICTRLNSMQRVPTWTNREQPNWTKETNHAKA